MRIFVGGLPYATTDAELEGLFSPHGAVTSASIVRDRFTDQSRGFAFVDMANSDEANKAIASLNGTSFGGRSLTVNEAKARDDRGGGSRGGGSGYGGGNRGGGDRGGYGSRY